MLNILYIVHDLSDPAVRRRVMMLQAGGAHVTLAGFRRGDSVAPVVGVNLVELGVTHDGDFLQRVMAVSRAAVAVRAKFGALPRPDLIMARNLEMLALGSRVRRVFGSNELPIVYECLDIHRLLLRKDFVGASLRLLERSLAGGAGLLLTSSPAFIREYFERQKQYLGPVELVENRHLELEETNKTPLEPSLTGPMRIGWFGALRCNRSLDVLSAFARTRADSIQVSLRGRPALAEIPDFHQRVESVPGLEFLGPYRNPEEISDIYSSVHFSWVIDFFEEGQNSKWLLPNRLYEGCRFGAVPIAVAGTEIARVLQDRRIGIVLDEATPEHLGRVLDGMDAQQYRRLRDDVVESGAALWSCGQADCAALVDRLRALTTGASRNPTSELMEAA